MFFTGQVSHLNPTEQVFHSLKTTLPQKNKQ